MSRRTFLASALAIALPATVAAQPPKGPPRIGWISTEPEPDPFLEGFREGLRERGYIEGRNVVLERRYASGRLDVLRLAVTELIGMGVAFIVSSGPAIRAIRSAENVTVLFAISGDPVELGIAGSLARPGRNFTGMTFLSLEIAGKRVDLLKQAVPSLRTLAVLSNTDHPGERSERRATEAAAQALGITTAYVPFMGLGELDDALGAVRQARPDAMIVFPEGATMVNRAKIASFAIAHRLPTMFGWSEYCDAGGLMCYGANQRETYARLADYADRLLRGAKPGDLPIEQPRRFELVLNAGTARLLGITVPRSVMAIASRVIE
ncbi:MAG TPA: ABC transporter substrate-binding protein [Methylomirabilota bacterium]